MEIPAENLIGGLSLEQEGGSTKQVRSINDQAPPPPPIYETFPIKFSVGEFLQRKAKCEGSRSRKSSSDLKRDATLSGTRGEWLQNCIPPFYLLVLTPFGWAVMQLFLLDALASLSLVKLSNNDLIVL